MTYPNSSEMKQTKPSSDRKLENRFVNTIDSVLGKFDITAYIPRTKSFPLTSEKQLPESTVERVSQTEVGSLHLLFFGFNWLSLNFFP